MALILIIDDNEALRTVMRRSLQNDGHEVLEAADGVEGTALVADRDPQVLVTDILMPTKEGLETIREVRAARPGIAIVAISGGGPMDGMDLLAIAREFGADAALAKPFRPGELRALVASLLKRAPA